MPTATSESPRLIDPVCVGDRVLWTLDELLQWRYANDPELGAAVFNRGRLRAGWREWYEHAEELP